MMSLAAFIHPSVQLSPEPEPVPAGVAPRCGAVDDLSGAICSVVAGHYGSLHVSEDQDFEFRRGRA